MENSHGIPWYRGPQFEDHWSRSSFQISYDIVYLTPKWQQQKSKKDLFPVSYIPSRQRQF